MIEHYPIAMCSGDTGSLTDLPGQFSAQTPAVRVISGGVVGALAAHFMGKRKHMMLGALIGVAGGFFAPKFIPPK
jgi:hypothetical protein